ncbi:MAG TPA: MBL fold metallo-hydrolase [Halanaerobiales bacterium]|nr:MBL fold metallo-hydrolase [Halanaerobiales bacterium]
MIISQTVGVNFTNCYLIGKKDAKAIIVDPGDEIDKIMELVEKNKVDIVKIINTHGHFDHISANNELKEKTNADIYIHEKDKEALINPEKNLSTHLGQKNLVKQKEADCLLNEGDIIKIEDYKFEVLHTPGHSPGSICLHDKENKILMSGDTIFSMGVGRTDFPGCSQEELINSIENKILNLPEETVVYPGHGQQTTIGKFKVKVWERLT